MKESIKFWIDAYSKASKGTAPDSQWFTLLVFLIIAPVAITLRYFQRKSS